MAKSVIVPLTQDPPSYVTTKDFDQIKIAGLILALSAVVQIAKSLFSFFSGERRDLANKVKHLDEQSIVLNAKMDQILLSIAQIKDSQISEHEIRNITRNEIDYRDRVKRSE